MAFSKFHIHSGTLNPVLDEHLLFKDEVFSFERMTVEVKRK
jgi:hypothetical protein